MIASLAGPAARAEHASSRGLSLSLRCELGAEPPRKKLSVRLSSVRLLAHEMQVFVEQSNSNLTTLCPAAYTRDWYSLVAARRNACGGDVVARPSASLCRTTLSILVQDVGAKDPILLNRLVTN